MKKRRMNGVKIQVGEKKSRLFIVPKEEAKGIVQILKKYEIETSIPWREALKDDLKKSSEGGLLVKSERTMAKMTQTELGKKIGVAQNVISEIESGDRPIGKKMAQRLAKFFKTDYRVFL
tara:strand:- start:3835 stop:4194 length:360 start_codon:yes stop_codon:yes gene_type:complete